MEELNGVNQRMREEVDMLNQELAAREAVPGQGAAPAPGGVPLSPHWRDRFPDPRNHLVKRAEIS